MIYISIGSNLGHRLNYLYQAVSLLKKYILNVQYSIILETKCILPDAAPLEWDKPFLNMIIAGDSYLSPELLLSEIKQIEFKLGRPEIYEKWAPRVIDLDILLWNDYILNKPYLKIPHPELANRPFLLHLLATMGINREDQVIKNCFHKSYALFPRFVGIVNVTSNSFSDGGLYNTTNKAISRAIKLSEEGASIIEIGAQSTRPGAIIQSDEQEYIKLKPILDGLMPLMQSGTMTISIDSFLPRTIQKIINQYPVSWINDVTGKLDDVTLKLIAKRKCKFCIMHSLGIPPQRNIIISHEKPPIDIILDWAHKNIEHLLSLGFQQESIIIDPGIGFGKSIYQNINILRHLETLKTLGLPLLVGHSRKSYIEGFSTETVQNRDIETIAISALLAHKVDYLRVHNVVDHMRFFVAQQAIQGGI